MTTEATPSEAQQPPKMYLIIFNISKKNNVKALIQTATAFQCAGIFAVGQRTFDFGADSKDLPQSIKEHVRAELPPIQRFQRWDECMEYLTEQKIRLVGVEIHQDAKAVDAFFDGVDTAFLMGNEGDGLNAKTMNCCDAFVRIPQYGRGTASLNVYVAASIILHRFHHWQRQVAAGVSS